MKRLLLLGDSLTQRFDWQKRFPEYRVTNLGISSERVEALLARIPRVQAESEIPDYIFLMTGINNIGEGHYDFLGTYQETVHAVTAGFRSSKTVVQSILPTTLTWIDNNRIHAINLRIRECALKYGAAYLDVCSLFVDQQGKTISEYFLEDGSHLSSKGYAVWSDRMELFLKQ